MPGGRGEDGLRPDARGERGRWLGLMPGGRGEDGLRPDARGEKGKMG